MSRSKLGHPNWLSDPNRLTPEIKAMLRKNAESAPGFIKRQPCKCIETGQEFKSLAEAASYFEVDNSTMKEWIGQSDKDIVKRRSGNRFHFEYV